LGRPDLFVEANRAANAAQRRGLAAILEIIGRLYRGPADTRLAALVELAQAVPPNKNEIEPWLLLELGGKMNFWLEELEGAAFNPHNAAVLIKVLPPFYEALDVPDRAARTQRLQQRTIQLLIKDRQFGPALGVLRTLPERQPKLEAQCHEGLGNHELAAECHRAAGNLKDALNCYRLIPNFEAALKLVGEIGDHPAAESLQWIAKLQALVNERPDKFTKVVTAAEKKLLQDLLERSLGVTRRKPAPKKAAAKKPEVKKAAAAPRKRAVRNTGPFDEPF
jgi:hypothetical protein